MTCHRDWFPSDINSQYLHIKKTDTSFRTIPFYFAEPILAVKEETTSDRTTYEHVHVSFQFTSSCNNSTINSLSMCKISVRAKERIWYSRKRSWVVEMNDTMALYLTLDGVVDNVDKLVKFSRMPYCSWKYCHTVMLHIKVIGRVIAYDMYIECWENL